MMYLIDTNVISELRKAGTKRIDKNVAAWTKAIPAHDMYLSVVSLLELETGTLLLERRDPVQGHLLRRWLTDRVLSAFSGRIIPVDVEIVRRCATLHVPDPRPDRDALIAATALVHGMTVVTRDVADFEKTGVALIDPWHA